MDIRLPIEEMKRVTQNDPAFALADCNPAARRAIFADP